MARWPLASHMPGRSGYFPRIAALVCVLAIVGYVVFGWRFGDGTTEPIAFVVALVAVALAVVATIRDRL